MSYYLIHSGKGHDDNPPGRGSGRYAFGSGKRPHQRMKKAEASEEEKMAAIKKYNIDKQYKKAIGAGKSDKLETARNATNEAANAFRKTGNILRNESNQKSWERMDLNNMTDQQLRDRINRENLEIQYSKMFNTSSPEATKGKQFMQKLFDVGGDVLELTGSSLTIAVAIGKLMGKI